MWLIGITKSNKPEKRLKATFCKCKKKDECKGSNHKEVHFGQKGSKTFIDGRTEKEKDNYIARHKVNENWKDATTAGALARFILWNKKTLSASISDFKKQFGI